MINQKEGLPVPDQGTQIGGKDGSGNFKFLSVASDGSIATTPAAGGATSAKQDTQITRLDSIITNTTGASTAANQATEIARLESIVTNTTGGATAAHQVTQNTKLDSIITNTATPTGTLVNSVAYEASRVLKASAGTLILLMGYNAKTSTQFIQVFNSATVPADTAVPVLTFTVPASSNFSLDVPVTGMPFSTGIAVSNSSTGPTKTIGAADCYFTAVVR